MKSKRLRKLEREMGSGKGIGYKDLRKLAKLPKYNYIQELKLLNLPKDRLYYLMIMGEKITRGVIYAEKVCKYWSGVMKDIAESVAKESNAHADYRFDQNRKTQFYARAPGLLINLGSTYKGWDFVYTRQVQKEDFVIADFLKEQARGLGLRAEFETNKEGEHYIFLHGVCDEKLLPHVFDLASLVNETISSMQRNREQY